MKGLPSFTGFPSTELLGESSATDGPIRDGYRVFCRNVTGFLLLFLVLWFVAGLHLSRRQFEHQRQMFAFRRRQVALLFETAFQFVDLRLPINEAPRQTLDDQSEARQRRHEKPPWPGAPLLVTSSG